MRLVTAGWGGHGERVPASRQEGSWAETRRVVWQETQSPRAQGALLPLAKPGQYPEQGGDKPLRLQRAVP